MTESARSAPDSDYERWASTALESAHWSCELRQRSEVKVCLVDQGRVLKKCRTAKIGCDDQRCRTASNNSRKVADHRDLRAQLQCRQTVHGIYD